MAPMIRVDDEVYEYLNQRGRTEDSFNDVVRRELGLTSKKQPAREEPPSRNAPGSDEMAAAPMPTLTEALNRHLPPHWSETPKRQHQILAVATEFLVRTDKTWPTAERLVHAAERVAKELEVEVNTVRDKYGRQLYGTGTGQQTERFQLALEAVEKDTGR